MHKRRKIEYTGLVLILLMITSLGFVFINNGHSTKNLNNHHQMKVNEAHFSKGMALPKMLEDKEVREITLSAIGDILIHDRVYEVAETDDGYDFSPMLQNVKPYLNNTDITFANQESVIGGEKVGLSTYPAFNSPAEIGDALKDDGVDIVSMANNHILDRGEEAIQNAISHWQKIGVNYTGAYKDETDQSRIRVIETGSGMDVAFLAYTYGTNGIEVPEGKDYLVNYIDEKQMKKDIKKALDEGDAVVLSLHFGEEYERMPNDEQKELVQFAADEGVDIVLGHHPHVLQPAEWIDGKDGGKMFAIYSLGNFLTGQDKPHTQVGGILKLTIRQTIENDESTIDVKEPSFMPTYVDIDDKYKVSPMHRVTDDQLSDSEEQYEEIKEHMSQWMPELEFIEE